MFQRAHQLMAFGFGIVLASSAAEPTHLEEKQDTIELIGSVEIHNSNIRNIQSTKHQGMNLLYLEDASNHTVTVVNVTDATRPIITKKIAIPDGLTSVEALAGEAALLADHSSPVSDNSKTVSVVNLGNSSDHHRMLTFTDVTAISTADQRGLIYLVDRDGLKILNKKFSSDPKIESEFTKRVRYDR
jgi:hypothetical protein